METYIQYSIFPNVFNLNQWLKKFTAHPDIEPLRNKYSCVQENGDVWTLGGIQFIPLASVSGTDTEIEGEAGTQIAVQYTVTRCK